LFGSGKISLGESNQVKGALVINYMCL